MFAALLRQLDMPGTLVIAGGETLRDVCDMLEAEWLEVDGEIMPGVSTSVMNGGRWDGMTVSVEIRCVRGCRIAGEAVGEGDDVVPVLALTMGDPAGIGPEIVVKAAARLWPRIEAGEFGLLVLGHATALREAAGVCFSRYPGGWRGG